ncbi:hypothetical protein EXIGLDRAFT_355890 [Exidia glandulosa HHB12029]|uniref:Uncharacterized protein n=1 Tax=Exidia glandulosa HHB12029 TaxID=1314781 RepID=A0A165CA84_EXIGL|nr:hypothetical protein EXIGLDRAFT_355890 [Exidia glandulosa HHB12029]
MLTRKLRAGRAGPTPPFAYVVTGAVHGMRAHADTSRAQFRCVLDMKTMYTCAAVLLSFFVHALSSICVVNFRKFLHIPSTTGKLHMTNR